MTESHIPYVHGRDLLPIRGQRRRLNARVRHLLSVEEGLRREIHDLDEMVVQASGRRRQLLEELGALIDQIRPQYSDARGRRRPAISHEEPLPPTSKRARPLWGRELRAICLAFLQRARGALTLRQLHALLHRAGYVLAHQHPVKALADALGHEADHGRAQRVARGTYAAGDSGSPNGRALSTIPDF